MTNQPLGPRQKDALREVWRRGGAVPGPGIEGAKTNTVRGLVKRGHLRRDGGNLVLTVARWCVFGGPPLPPAAECTEAQLRQERICAGHFRNTVSHGAVCGFTEPQLTADE